MVKIREISGMTDVYLHCRIKCLPISLIKLLVLVSTLCAVWNDTIHCFIKCTVQRKINGMKQLFDSYPKLNNDMGTSINKGSNGVFTDIAHMMPNF